jgi:surface protein
MAYAKINSVTNANMAKVSNVAKAAIGKIANIDAPSSDDAFTFTMNTENAGSATKTFVLPLVDNGSINFTVDWGDSSTDTITAYDQAEITHEYSSTGTYTVKLEGTIRGFKFNNGGDKLKILNISNWGDMNITDGYTFYGCNNLTSDATDSPTISTTTFRYMFLNCYDFVGSPSMNNWDISSVTNLTSMFGNCSVFNQDLNSWNTSNVTKFESTFSSATQFNGNVTSWDTSSATSMSQTFKSTAFNQDISGWDTSIVTSMYGMFRRNDVFNQDISSWDTSSLTNVGYMFDSADNFNQSLADWDIEDITTYTNFMSGVTLSTANYDAILIAWAAQDASDSEAVHFGSSTYTSGGVAAAARQSLIDDDSWTITDGGTA